MISVSVLLVKMWWCVRICVDCLCSVVFLMSFSCSSEVNMWNGLCVSVLVVCGWNVVECIGMLVMDRL